ncbi:MAG: aminoacyl-tRNA hydrolase [Alphaproteobacteria bacterium]|nr:aminoacyl-tRNA hydrolase [Alphaproteobacteria bacterium]
MKLIVGLGNPGQKYERNRHNVGFMAVDRIAERHEIGPFRRRFQGLVAEGRIGAERVVVLKPQTYMNESGQSVGEAARFLKIDDDDVIVLYDEIDLAPGKLKAKLGGGNAGHNGLRSISAHIDNDYTRIRIGVGHPGSKELVAGYVLHDFARSDYEWLEPLLDAIAESAGPMAEGDLAKFTAAVARRLGQGDEPDRQKPERRGRSQDAGDGPSATKPKRSRNTGGHPAGDQIAKRQNAIAENLRKWMQSRAAKDSGNKDDG